MMTTILLTAVLGLCSPAPATPDNVSPEPPPTPAERAIRSARALAQSHADDPRAWDALAMAHARRARETADPEHYERGLAALEKSLELDAEGLGAKKARAWILLGQHRFEEARELARELERLVPDDIAVYGYLVDASIELGDLEAAETAAQWMLDLRPGNPAGLCRAAYLRELFGDPTGALELYSDAYHALPAAETEDRAWVLVQIGHVLHATGADDDASGALEAALELFPDYHYALAGLAAVRTAQDRHDEAIELAERRFEVAPHPENALDVARALEAAGDGERAAELYAHFEREARAESESADNANRELALFLVDRGGADEAVRLLERELERRRDPATRAAYAWALFRAGRPEEAQGEMERALAPGLKDATLLLRAATIDAARNEPERALERARESLRLQPRSPVADAARELVRELGGE